MTEVLNNIDITSSQYKTVLNLLKHYIPNTEVWAYGSRVKWTSTPKSDFDVVAFAFKEQKLAVSNLKEAFEESNLPFRVDFFVWDEIPEQFHENIKKEHVTLQRANVKKFMPDGWKEYKLENVCIKITDGAHHSPRSVDFGYPMASVKDMTNFGFNLDICRHISKEDFEKLVRNDCKPLKNDVLIAKDGNSYLQTVLVMKEEIDLVILSSIAILRPNTKLIAPEFLKYYLCSPYIKESVKNGHGSGSAIPRVVLKDFKSIQIKIPVSVQEQKAIANILCSLDNKIELNRQMNKTLESIAQTIFKSWFVDFDPVKAKAEGRQPEGLPEEIADLFLDGFEESELGEIPKGWKISTLGEVICYLTRGISPKYVEEGGVLVINQRCIRDNRVNYENARRHDTTKRSIEGRLLELGDVVVNSTGVGTLGRVAQIDYLDENSIVDSHVTIVRADENIIKKTLLGFALIMRQSEIEALGEGSTGQTELSRQRLNELSLIVPNIDIQNEFAQIVKPIKEKIVINEKENLLLIKTRDSLLPKLISGEIRVSEAEKFIEGAA